MKIFENTLITDIVPTFGLLALCLGLVFYTAGLPSWKKFYGIVPALFMCYFLPALLNSTNIISSEHENLKSINTVAGDFFLPASLLLLTLGIDLKALAGLGWKPILLFLMGSVGVVIGGPIALWLSSIFFPELLEASSSADELWRGLSTVAGSWIGGGANQLAMLEIYEFNKSRMGEMLLIDIVIAEIWMALLLIGIGKKEKINTFLRADNSSVLELQTKAETYSESIKKIATLRDYMMLAALAFGGIGLAYVLASLTSQFLQNYDLFVNPKSYYNSFSKKFLWLIIYSTIIGVVASATSLKKLEGAGASKLGSAFIYLLVAVIGVKMDLSKIFENIELLLLGAIWMAIHVIILFVVAYLIKAPYFFIAVGSKANIGGAASAPVVAAAFHPSLAPVGAMLAILGYVVGTFAAMICAILMQMV